MSATTNLGLPYIDAGQAQKHVTHNEALRALDRLVQLAIEDRDLAVPPVSPDEGKRWIVGAGATGAWSAHAGHIAAWQDGAWMFSAPLTGWLAYVIDEEILAAWDGAAWSAVTPGGGDLTELQDLALLGIGTEADATNPFASKLNNVLWEAKTVAEGGDGTLRYKMTKESAAKTLSILLQDNYSGRAEIGLTGDDDFHFKVSPDGTSWLEAIKIDHTTGRVQFPSGGVREILAANRTFYVRTDGSDANTGLSNTSGGAFLTIQAAVNAAARLDLNGFMVAIQIADGTYSGQVALKNVVGFSAPGDLVIQGNNGTPANVVVSASTLGNNGAIQSDSLSSVWDVKDLKIVVTTSGHGLNATRGGKIRFGNLNFGAIASDHMRAADFGEISVLSGGNYAISGGAARHVEATTKGIIRVQSVTASLSGTPAFSSAFAVASQGALLLANSMTWSGSATGARYSVSEGAEIYTGSGGTSYFPGNASGAGTDYATSPWGLYA